jgi:hypothetical protein
MNDHEGKVAESYLLQVVTAQVLVEIFAAKEDKVEDVSSYSMTLRKRKDNTGS